MDEITELRERIALLEQKLSATDLSLTIKDLSGSDESNKNRDTGNSVVSLAGVKLSAFDVIWYPKPGAQPAWYVYFPGNCFEYKGMTTKNVTPVPDENGFIGLTSTASTTDVYLHAVIGLDDEGIETSLKSITIDTNSTKSAQNKEKVVDVKLAEIRDYSVGQIVKGKLIYGGNNSSANTKVVPTPFQYDVTETEDPDTHEKTKSGSISNCTFYWDGELQELEDYSPSKTCTVYLVCTQDAPSSSGEQEWEFEIAEEEGEATEGGRVVNYKLYDIEDYEVTMDYRTTFLELNSPHKFAKFVVEKPTDDDHPSVTLDATSDTEASVSAVVDSTHSAEMKADSTGGKVSLAAGDKSATLDPSDLKVGATAGIHKLTVTHSDGTTTEYDVFSDKDISITEGGGGGGELPDIDVLKDIELKYDTSTHYFTAKKTTVNLKTQKETVGNPETIFTAAPHYQNENPPNLTGVTFDQ